MKATVVVPTFNRGPALARTLSALLRTEMPAGESYEVIVVDDGSRVLAREAAAPGLTPAEAGAACLRFLRQANAGPASARNAGFQAALGDVVLFVDDDILVPPGLVAAHVAAHRRHPGSVIFGLCPFAPGPDTAFRRFLQREADGVGEASDFVPAPIVASGQLSVETTNFATDHAVYASHLTTPAAEEYELSVRLRSRGIPILCATRIVALHDQPVALAPYCRQQYKHGVGCAEVAAKVPASLALGELANIVKANRVSGSSLRPQTFLKNVFASRLGRRLSLAAATALEVALPEGGLSRHVYRAAIAAHFVGGIRDGFLLFADQPERGNR